MVGDVNLNFTSPARIVNRVEGIGSAIAQAICGKRPYFSADDVIEKNPDHGAVLKRSSRAVRMPLIRSSRTRRQAALIPTTRMKTYIFPLVVFIAKVDWVFFFFILSLTEGSIELLFYNTSSSLGRSNYHFIYFYLHSLSERSNRFIYIYIFSPSRGQTFFKFIKKSLSLIIFLFYLEVRKS